MKAPMAAMGTRGAQIASGTGAAPGIRQEVQPSDDEQPGRGRGQPDLPMPGTTTCQPRPGDSRRRDQAGADQACQHSRGMRRAA